MKKIALIVILLLSLNKVYSQNREQVFEINKIVFYRDKAQILSSKEVLLKPGQNRISINNLPSFIETKSINLESNADVLVMNLKYEKYTLDSTGIVGQYSDSILTVSKEIELLKKIDSLLQNQSLKIENNDKRTSSDPTTNDKISWINFSQKANLTIIMQRDSIANEITKRNQKIEYYQSKTSYQKNNVLERGRIVALVHSKKALNAKFTLEYVTGEASWYPTYEVYYQTDKSEIDIKKHATIYQNTGLDILSDDVCFKNLEFDNLIKRPMLYPTYYTYTSPSEQRSNIHVEPGSMMQMSAGTIRNYDKVKDDDKSNVQFENFISEIKKEIDTNANDNIPIKPDKTPVSDVENRLPIDNFLIKNNQSYTFYLNTINFSPKIETFLIPRIDHRAFTIAKISKTQNIFLQSDTLKLFRDNVFSGTSIYTLDAVSDTLVLTLGYDKSIHSEFVESNDYSKTSLFGKYKYETKTHLIVIRNENETPVSISLFDKIPITTENDLDIKLIDAAHANYKSYNGKLEWMLDVSKHNTQIIRVVYAIKSLKNKSLYIKE